MGAILLAAGARASARACRTAACMIHQPLGGFRGQATDIEIHAREILRWQETLNDIMSHHTGQPIERDRRRHRARQHHDRRCRPRNTASSTK